jgi:hypothetical protein
MSKEEARSYQLFVLWTWKITAGQKGTYIGYLLLVMKSIIAQASLFDDYQIELDSIFTDCPSGCS